jgi:hypothetical protein
MLHGIFFYSLCFVLATVAAWPFVILLADALEDCRRFALAEAPARGKEMLALKRPILCWTSFRNGAALCYPQGPFLDLPLIPILIPPAPP